MVNAQEGKTDALRQIRFTSIDDIDKNAVLQYVIEAVKNQKEGKEITPDRTKKETVIPVNLKQELDNDLLYLRLLKPSSPSKQRNIVSIYKVRNKMQQN